MQIPDDWLDQLKAAYPARRGGQVWPAVIRLVTRHFEDGCEFEPMLKGAQNYRTYFARRGELGSEYVMMARTFFGRDMHWLEWAEMDMRTPAEIALDAKWEALEARARALGFKEVDRSRGLATVEYAIKHQEDQRKLRVVS